MITHLLDEVKYTCLSCNGLFHFLSVQGDGRKKFKSIFTLDFFDMNILPPLENSLANSQ